MPARLISSQQTWPSRSLSPRVRCLGHGCTPHSRLACPEFSRSIAARGPAAVHACGVHIRAGAARSAARGRRRGASTHLRRHVFAQTRRLPKHARGDHVAAPRVERIAKGGLCRRAFDRTRHGSTREHSRSTTGAPGSLWSSAGAHEYSCNSGGVFLTHDKQRRFRVVAGSNKDV